MDRQGNVVSQAQVDAQTAARQALEEVPDVTAEEILDKPINDDGNDPFDDYELYKELLQVESPLRENVKTKKNVGTSNSEDDEDDNPAEPTPTPDTKKRKVLPSAGPNKDNATPPASKKPKTQPTPPSGHRDKR
jgi:hypothetical protein